MVEPASGSFFGAASTTAASVATQFRRAKDERCHLPNPPGAPTNRRGNKRNRNAPPLAGALKGGCSVTKRCAARLDRSKSDSASGKESCVRDGNIAPEGFCC